MTRQKNLIQAYQLTLCTFEVRDLEHHLGSKGPRRGEGCFHLRSKYHWCWGWGKRELQGPTWYNPEWPYWNLSQTEHPRSPAWLQEDRIFGQDKGCSRSQADIWVLIKVGFYTIYVFALTSWDVPRAAERWQAHTALNMFLISIWQDTVLPRDFSSQQLTALAFVFQQSLKFSAKAETPHLVGACTVCTRTTSPHPKWFHV